jgi:hypothetical protein
MRKKDLFGFFLVALAISGTGCTNDQLVEQKSDPQAISFRTQGGTPETRTTGTTTGYVNAFVVYGTDNVFAATNELIFDGVTVARQVGAGDVFKYSPLKYYGENAAQAGFFAYSPVSKFVTAPVTANFLTLGASFDYEVPAPDATGNTTQEDFLVAGAGVASPSATPVLLNFQHALSRIFVKAKSAMEETITITGLTLKNLNSKGTLSVTTGSGWSWGTLTDSKAYPYQLAATGVAVNTNATATLVTSMEQGMMVLPQETTDATFELEVKYNVANLTDVTKSVKLGAYEFEAGKQYAITIDFIALDAITFTIDVTTFDTQIIDLP